MGGPPTTNRLCWSKEVLNVFSSEAKMRVGPHFLSLLFLNLASRGMFRSKHTFKKRNDFQYDMTFVTRSSMQISEESGYFRLVWFL